jgi:hypothetical protein
LKYLVRKISAVEFVLSSEPTRISFPVKVILGVAVTFQIQPQLISGRAMREWDMVVCDVVEEVDLLLFEEEAGCDGVNWGVAPSLIEKSAILI